MNSLQGRGIETNLYARFKCDSLKIGMVIPSCFHLQPYKPTPTSPSFTLLCLADGTKGRMKRKLKTLLYSGPFPLLIQSFALLLLLFYLFIKAFFVSQTQVKHPEVAQFLGGRLYDCVFKYNEASS